jgi:hypothetical protein
VVRGPASGVRGAARDGLSTERCVPGRPRRAACTDLDETLAQLRHVGLGIGINEAEPRQWVTAGGAVTCPSPPSSQKTAETCHFIRYEVMR